MKEKNGNKTVTSLEDKRQERVDKAPGGGRLATVVDLTEATFVELTTQQRTQAVAALTALLTQELLTEPMPRGLVESDGSWHAESSPNLEAKCA